MNFRKLLMASVCMSTIGMGNYAFAQENENQEIVKTREVNVKAGNITVPYKPFKGVESGKNTIEGAGVAIAAPSSGDANELLKILPSVQYDNNRNDASRAGLQDIHPLDISISGGKFYENNISIDGVGVNTRLDVTDPNPAAADDVAGNRAQTHWIDTSSIEKIELLDSNISAQHGQFTGGVLNVITKDPIGEYGLKFSSSCTNEEMTSFAISEITKAALGSSAIPDKPEYNRCNIGGTIDLPSFNGTNISVTHNKSFSEVTNYKAATYGGGAYKQASESNSTTIKAMRNFGDLFTLSSGFTHSPYSSEFQVSNQVQNQIISYGGGDRANLSLKSRNTPLLGAKDWSFNLTYSNDNSSRKAAAAHYLWPSSVAEFRVCSSSSCSFGGNGNIEQREKELILSTKLSWNAPLGKLNFGTGYEKVDAKKVRDQNLYQYLAADINSAISCGVLTDAACREGAVALTERIVRGAFDIKVSLETANLWTEWDAKLGNLAFRIGARAEYDSFLENTDIAPRFIASYDFGKFEFFAGANRYYSKSFLGFAIREQMPDTYRHARKPTIINGKRVYTDSNWAVSTHTKSTTYKNANLDTPYSDEIAVGVNFELPLSINTRLKYVNRKGKDIIVAGDDINATYVNQVTGKIVTYRTRTATNNGHSDYESLSLELSKSFGKNHNITFNIAWSDLKSYGNTYFDDDIYEEDMVYYQGKLISFEEFYNLKQQANFNTPLMANFGINSNWLNGKLKTNITVRWRDAYETIEDTGIDIKVSNITYDIYDKIEFKASTEADLKLDYELISEGRNKVNITANIVNLFDNTQYPLARNSSNPYEKGRTIWLGLKLKY